MPDKPATPQQQEAIRDLLPPEDQPDFKNLSFGEAVRILDAERWRMGRATPRQKKFLEDLGLWESGMTFGDAWFLIANAKAEIAKE